MAGRILLATLLCLAGATTALAKEYRASRFDARIEVLNGGALRVTETIVFEFTEGTFREVFRLIPTSRTDGVEFVSASMDGKMLPQGEGPGQVRVRRKNGLRIEWHFTPVSPSTHTFELTYVAHGVVRQTDGADLLEWRALPREHDYRIAASTVAVVAPAAPVTPPQLETRRVDGQADLVVQGSSVIVEASDIRRNGSLTVTVPLPPHSVLDGPPAWQARQAAQFERMPVWVTGAVGVLFAGLVLIFALRQNYDAPPPGSGVKWASMIPPDPLPPAIAGTLTSNGQPQLEHAMAALFSLAERGIITIREDAKRTFGQRAFTIERVRASGPLAPHEEAAIEIAMEAAGDRSGSVPLSKARSQFTRPRNWTRFKNAVMGELAAAQLLDEGRQAHKRRYLKVGLVLLGLALVSLVPCFLLLGDNGGWPFLVPLAIAGVALTSFIVMASQTPLSNEGVRRAEQWRAFKDHIADPQRIEPRWGASGTAEARVLPFAIALGLAAAWSKFMKKRNTETPSWFQPASGLESGHAFAALVASGGAHAHGHGHGGAGVAGGGASGAR